MTAARQQQLIDALQVIAPLADRVSVTAKQQQFDAERLLEAARRAVQIVKQQQEEDNR